MPLSKNFLIIYTWFVRVITFFLPDIPVFQKLRGWLYSFGMKKCGKRFRVSYNVILNRLELLEIGENVYFAAGCIVVGGGEISIGDNVLFGPNVILAASNHKFDGESFAKEYVFGKVVIEKNCWIGGNSSILMGAHVPHSSIVGAGSVCTGPLTQPHSLYAGAPARYIKSIAV
jgi:acetyltransferase-like isoleucine patch superfamily enzyme